MLRIPGFSETNLFDSVYDTLDRIDRLEGHKYVILISSGRDTFSKINLDQCLKKIKATSNVTIYAISIGRALREMADARGMVGPIMHTRCDSPLGNEGESEHREYQNVMCREWMCRA